MFTGVTVQVTSMVIFFISSSFRKQTSLPLLAGRNNADITYFYINPIGLFHGNCSWTKETVLKVYSRLWFKPKWLPGAVGVVG